MEIQLKKKSGLILSDDSGVYQVTLNNQKDDFILNLIIIN